MLTKEQRDQADKLWNLISDAQCDDDPDVEELRVALSRCVDRFDNEQGTSQVPSEPK